MAETERGRCGWCRAWIGLYQPRGGDGSMFVLRVHNASPGERCAGSRREPEERKA